MMKVFAHNWPIFVPRILLQNPLLPRAGQIMSNRSNPTKPKGPITSGSGLAGHRFAKNWVRMDCIGRFRMLALGPSKSKTDRPRKGIFS